MWSHAVILPVFFFTVSCSEASSFFSSIIPSANAQAGRCGKPCGECSGGTSHCRCDSNECRFPSFQIDGVVLPAADTGARTTFDPDDYSNVTDEGKITAAGAAADSVDGAVVMSRTYTLTNTATFYEGVMYTGGLLRRKCHTDKTVTAEAGSGDNCVVVDNVDGVETSRTYILNTGVANADTVVAAFTVNSVNVGLRQVCRLSSWGADVPIGAKLVRVYDMVKMSNPSSTDNIVIDSVAFDGRFDCNGGTNDWLYSNTLSFRGANTVRNSYFYDTPSENLTICGATVEDNVAYNLQGSFVHISCSVGGNTHTVARNYTENTNLATNAVTSHSEGVITYSTNGDGLDMDDNVFRNGEEAVLGRGSSGDEGMTSDNDCFANFDVRLLLVPGTDDSQFVFTNAEYVNVTTQTLFANP